MFEISAFNLLAVCLSEISVPSAPSPFAALFRRLRADSEVLRKSPSASSFGRARRPSSSSLRRVHHVLRAVDHQVEIARVFEKSSVVVFSSRSFLDVFSGSSR